MPGMNNYIYGIKIMEIRLAGISDIEQIDAIYNQAIELQMATADTKPYPWEKRLKWFNDHTPEEFPVYVAEIEGSVIAYFSLSPYRPGREALKYAVEISYFIEEKFRGRGIGSLMMESALKIAVELGYRDVIAILLGHNRASIGLLEKFGFERWGVMPGIAEFDGKKFDHLYYGKKLRE
jgi:phosphinothricin acetyltransferase